MPTQPPRWAAPVLLQTGRPQVQDAGPKTPERRVHGCATTVACRPVRSKEETGKLPGGVGALVPKTARQEHKAQLSGLVAVPTTDKAAPPPPTAGAPGPRAQVVPRALTDAAPPPACTRLRKPAGRGRVARPSARRKGWQIKRRAATVESVATQVPPPINEAGVSRSPTVVVAPPGGEEVVAGSVSTPRPPSAASLAVSLRVTLPRRGSDAP